MSSGCPLCGAENYTILYDRLQYPGSSIVKCDHCFHIYTLSDHQPETEKLYNDEVYQVIENRHTIFDKILNWEYNRVIRNINSFKPKKGSLLDFGCGKGKFASIAKNKGWQVKCVETAKERAEYAKKIYGLEVSTNLYSTGKLFNQYFDALILFHVLEHLANPKILLSELIKHNLKKEALVVIEVPNIKSLQARIAGSKWMHLDIPRHISHFTSVQLEQMARESGLVTRQTTFFSFHLGVLGMIDSLLKLFGYRQNIIYELKNKKNRVLILAILFSLPFAVILEFVAAVRGRGGIIRKYFILKNGITDLSG